MEKYKVIIVEDEPPILDMIKEIVNSSCECFEVSATAYNGRDAIKEIMHHEPDVVITDIRMPHIDGLELIKRIRSKLPHTRFVIISGYSDFEYARTAMRFGVRDYMLKPIDNQKLIDNFGEIKLELDSREHINISNYIQMHLGLFHNEITKEPDFSCGSLFLFFAHAGTLTKLIYGELSPGCQYWRDYDFSKITDCAKEFDAEVLTFPGKYPNERVFAVLFHSSVPNIDPVLIERIFSNLLSDKIFINLTVSQRIEKAEDIHEQSQHLNEIMLTNSVFGFNKILDTSIPPISDITFISEKMRKRLELLVFSGFEKLCSDIEKLVGYWEENEYLQIKLLYEIDYIIASACKYLKIQDAKNIVTAEELLINSVSYDDLFSGLCIEFEKLYNKFHDEHTGAKKLVDTMEKYLVENYNKNLTYETFYNLFGYNQKYITSLFKNEKSISPSKYITKLRMERAKFLLDKNPEILLKDISKLVGYDDPLYFSKVFKDYYGQSPSKYTDTH